LDYHLKKHLEARQQLWGQCEIEIEGDMYQVAFWDIDAYHDYLTIVDGMDNPDNKMAMFASMAGTDVANYMSDNIQMERVDNMWSIRMYDTENKRQRQPDICVFNDKAQALMARFLMIMGITFWHSVLFLGLWFNEPRLVSISSEREFPMINLMDVSDLNKITYKLVIDKLSQALDKYEKQQLAKHLGHGWHN